MTNNRQSTTDGENYLSRCRVNRHIVTLNGLNAQSETVSLNGKVSKIIIDASDANYAVGSGNLGTLTATMDIEDNAGAEINYFDVIGLLNYSGSGTDQVALLEVTPGSNRGTASSKNSLHLSVSAPAGVTSGGTIINEPAAWNGLVCGKVRFTAGVTPAPNHMDPESVIRIIIFLE